MPTSSTDEVVADGDDVSIDIDEVVAAEGVVIIDDTVVASPILPAPTLSTAKPASSKSKALVPSVRYAFQRT
jgi:hypothetical protein